METKSIQLQEEEAQQQNNNLSLADIPLSIDSYALLLDDFCRRTIIQWIEEYVQYLENSSNLMRLFQSPSLGLPLFILQKYSQQFHLWKRQVQELENKINIKLHQQFESISNQIVKKIPSAKTYLLCLEYSMKIEKSLVDTYQFAKQKDTHQLIQTVLWYTHDLLVSNQKAWNQQMQRIGQVQSLYQKECATLKSHTAQVQMNDLIQIETLKLRNTLKDYFILQIQKSLAYIASYYQEAISNIDFMSHSIETKVVNPHQKEIENQLNVLQKDAEGSELFPLLIQVVNEYHSLYEVLRKYKIAINDLTWIQTKLLQVKI